MKTYTIHASKPKYTTYVHHGVRTPQGGSFSTNDSGWSLKNAIQFEINHLSIGTQYTIERNGENDGTVYTK